MRGSRRLRRALLVAAALGSTWAAGSRLHAQAASSSGKYDRLKSLSLDELMDVQITSVSGHAEELRDAPSAIQVISHFEIARSTASTIPEALRLANNLNIAQKNPHDWAISARGFNANVGNKLLVLMDGRSVYTPLFAGVFWNAQDYILDDVDQIEVISGPGGTLWGANAVNGVININTKNARETQGWLLEAAAGDELENLTAGRYGGKIAPNIFFRVYVKAMEYDAGVLTGGHAAADGWKQAQSGFRLDADLPAGDSLTVQGDVYAGDLDMQTGDTARMGGGNVLARWIHPGAGDSQTKAQFYLDRTHLAVPFAATGFAPAGFLKDDLDTADFSFQHTTRWGERQWLTGGFGYRFSHDAVKQQAPNVAYLPAQLDRSLASVFMQDEISLAPNLTATLGSKLEHNDYTGFEYEPSLRLQWKINATNTAWTAVSRAVRMPSRFDHDLYEPAPPNALITGGPHFVSEILIAYETGYRAQWTSRFSTAVSVFYNDYDKLRSWGITPVTVLPVTFQNGLDAKTYGFEFNADLQLSEHWRLNAGFNLLREHVRVKPGAFDLQNALDETGDPPHQAALHSIVDLPHGVQFDTAVRWVDELRNNNGGQPGTVPAYTELDLRLAGEIFPNVELALIGRNLLHDHHPEYNPPGPAREELQRSLLAKITWRY